MVPCNGSLHAKGPSCVSKQMKNDLVICKKNNQSFKKFFSNINVGKMKIPKLILFKKYDRAAL